jgi:hypothetical protein
MHHVLTDDQLRKEPRRIQNIFFEAMLAGYASERSEEIELAMFPDSKHVEYETGLWRVTDTWHTPPDSEYSGGETKIYYRDRPVWMMHYYGAYPKSAIPILKAALRTTYLEREFCGGRGIEEFVHADGEYHNVRDVTYRSFEAFRGTEYVLLHTADKPAYHFYHGGLML